MTTEDRRTPGATRIPFDGLVEVGGALGPSFEAQAINLSEEGMLLRTAYLPEPGQPLTCRFDAGPGENVLASGEVVWSHSADKGGEFAIRFTDMDADSVDALKRACGLTATEEPAAQLGSKVRLHIEGLGSPMRAKVKSAQASAVTVGSDLGFLQVGKQLELEDAQSGRKRPANIDRVEVAVDPGSHVPQLVVTLRYADANASAGFPRATDASVSKSELRNAGDIDDAEASLQMKGAVARSFSRIGPAIERFAQRTKTTVALLAQRRKDRTEDLGAVRRTTAPAPGGGLHTNGRRVVRGDADTSAAEIPVASTLKVTKRKALIASAVMVAAVVGAVIIKKAHHEDMAEISPPVTQDTSAIAAATSSTAASPVTVPALQPAPAPAPIDLGPTLGSSAQQPVAAVDDSDNTVEAVHKKHEHVAPFGNGPVHHGNILRLKMDSPIENIEGAQQPTGFTVKLPGRKSLEAAGPLASRDSRIGAIKVANNSDGAELTVAFKDGVPNYQVSAKGDTLVIALAPAGTLDHSVAKKDEKGGKSSKHSKHEHRHHAPQQDKSNDNP